MGRITIPEADAILDKKVGVLDHGFVSLIDYLGGDQRIAEAAWVSSIDEVEAEKKTPKAIKRIINYMMKNRHTSPFEQVELVFRARMPIFVARQWVHHRTASLNEMSGRYRILPDRSYVPSPERLQGKGKSNKQGSEGELDAQVKDRILSIMRTEQNEAFFQYHGYDELGLSNELCRLNLPLSAYTEWYWKIDLHNFLHFAGLRCDSHAQWEVRQYAWEMYDMAKKVAPMACAAWEEHFFHAAKLSEQDAVRAVGVLQRIIEQDGSQIAMDLKDVIEGQLQRSIRDQ